MAGFRFPRALIVLALTVSLAALPAAAQAAPRDADRTEGGIPLLARLVDWVSSIWGAGGGNFDPTGRTPTSTPTAPVAAPSSEEPPAAASGLEAESLRADGR
jgi:hypothetical protein